MSYKLYVQKINLDNNKRVRRKQPKLCPDCKEINDCVKLISGKLEKIEETINNFGKNFSNQSTTEFSKFNAKFNLNNVPCELEYNLSDFHVEDLQKLANITIQICNKNSNSSSISSNKDDNNESDDSE